MHTTVQPGVDCSWHGQRTGASCIGSCVYWSGCQGATFKPPITVNPKLPPSAVCLTLMCFCLSWVDTRSKLLLEIDTRFGWCGLIGDGWV